MSYLVCYQCGAVLDSAAISARALSATGEGVLGVCDAHLPVPTPVANAQPNPLARRQAWRDNLRWLKQQQVEVGAAELCAARSVTFARLAPPVPAPAPAPPAPAPRTSPPAPDSLGGMTVDEHEAVGTELDISDEDTLDPGHAPARDTDPSPREES